MKRLVFGCLLLVIAGATVREAFALGTDFTKDQIAAAGKHCVHGFWVNEQSVVFYAGDAAQLNRDLPKYLEGEYVSRKVVLHVGTKRGIAVGHKAAGHVRRLVRKYVGRSGRCRKSDATPADANRHLAGQQD